MLLNTHGLKLYNKNRPGGRGGRVAPISKSQYSVTLITTGSYSSFEHATWKVDIRGKPITLTGIYHPQYTSKNKITNVAFLDQFTEPTIKLLPDTTNNIITGDFNIHISNEGDDGATIFNDSIEALGLYQHVTFPTHTRQNVLDLLLISEVNKSINILTTAQGPYLSDHCAVVSTLNIKKCLSKTSTRMVRHTKRVTPEQWLEEFNPANIEITSKLDDMVESLNTELSRTLDKLAPLRKYKARLRIKQPWYDRSITTLKRKVCKLERKWNKYKYDSNWKAFKSARNSYYPLLNTKKKTVLKEAM